MTSFTPIPSFLGGLFLSYSTSALLVTQGRVLGCSGVAHSSIATIFTMFARLSGSKVDKRAPSDSRESELGRAPSTTSGWKVAAFAGLVAGGGLVRLLQPILEGWTGSRLFDAFPSGGDGAGRAILAGLLVGAGTKLANGCTSGHMLLGLARFSRRSLAAVLTFFSVALVTARVSSAPTHLFIPPPSSAGAATPSSALVLLSLPFLLSLPSVTYSLPLLHRRPALASLVHTFSSAVLFSIGLSLTGMLRPSKVISFFYLPLPSSLVAPAPGPWDPSLAMVALGGLVPSALVWQKVKGWKTPLRTARWEVPQGGKVDGWLFLGSALFGVGWGLSGICPGPLFTVLGAGVGGLPIALFAAAFAAGGLLAG
ncbi:hypothetical protein JCM11251_001882 [Rhodosporidiobolus azoricus]